MIPGTACSDPGIPCWDDGGERIKFSSLLGSLCCLFVGGTSGCLGALSCRGLTGMPGIDIKRFRLVLRLLACILNPHYMMLLNHHGEERIIIIIISLWSI